MSAKKQGGYIRVQVTEADIKKAQAKNSMRCVVAQAIARTIPDATRIDVDVQTIRWSATGERHIYLTPYSVQGYVVAFDAGDKIEPFTFTLDHRRRMPVRQHKLTDAGREITKARTRRRDAQTKLDQLELLAKGERPAPAERAVAGQQPGRPTKALPPPTPAEQAVAKERIQPARDKLTEAQTSEAGVRAAYKGAVQVERRPDTPPRQAPPKVHKTSERHYGYRVLRVNQPPA